MKVEDFFRQIGYVTLKLTNGCNLRCSYCNVEAVTPRTPRMSMERFKQVAQLLLTHSRHSRVGLEFHGGEPLLLPDEWFEEATAYARGLARQYGKSVDFPLTTNGTLLTEERLLRLQRLGLLFCMSVDGPPNINDLLRGGGLALERAIRLFRKHRVHFGVLTVLSRSNYQRMNEVMDWFAEVGIDNFRVNFLQPQGRGADESGLLTGEEMFEGMRQTVEHMDRTGVSVEEAEAMMMVKRFLHGRDPRPGLSCWEVECQAGRLYCAIDHSGTIHACGTDLSHHPLGHLDADLDDQHYKTTLLRLHKKDDWVIRCFDCDARKICRHSCPTSDYNSDNYREYECHFTKLMYQHLCKHPEQAQRIEAALTARRGPPIGSTFVPESQLRLVNAN
jgi:uncharacterized protein